MTYASVKTEFLGLKSALGTGFHNSGGHETIFKTPPLARVWTQRKRRKERWPKDTNDGVLCPLLPQPLQNESSPKATRIGRKKTHPYCVMLTIRTFCDTFQLPILTLGTGWSSSSFFFSLSSFFSFFSLSSFSLFSFSFLFSSSVTTSVEFVHRWIWSKHRQKLIWQFITQFTMNYCDRKSSSHFSQFNCCAKCEYLITKLGSLFW